MNKRVPLRDRNTVNTQIPTTVRVRRSLETLARKERVPVAVIGRRALTEFLDKIEGKSAAEQEV
jgi:hypothetical protein